MAKMKDCSNRGRLMVMIGLLVIAPLGILPLYPRDRGYAIFFLLPGLLSILVGALVCAFGKRETYFSSDRLTAQRHSNNTVLFTWFWGIAADAMPFFLSGKLKFVQAIFESVSGWTTTGLSVMDVTQTSHIFLFYRSFMQYCGGLGFVLMMVMLVTGKRSMDLFNAEGHPDKLMPNLKQTAQTIFEMYIIFLIVGTAAYSLFNKISFLKIHVDSENCTSCGLCRKACDMGVDVTKNPDSAECIRCGKCVSTCPRNVLHMGMTIPKQKAPAKDAK